VTGTGSDDLGILDCLDCPPPVRVPEALDSAGLCTLLDELATSLLEGTRLATRVMLLTELGDAAERRANAAVDAASGDPGDETAIEHAVAASAALTEVSEQEDQASARWANHRVRAAELARQAHRATMASETAEDVWSRSQDAHGTIPPSGRP